MPLDSKPNGCSIGCGLLLILAAIGGISGALSGDDEEDYDPAPPPSRISEPNIGPGSLCEGSDYLYYDDCL